ncbi:MAG: hypothetical protein AB7S26_09915 [Sandaracinaceae bacterium]
MKRAAPAARYGESGTRARVYVRCVCGHEQTVFVNDLQAGKSSGCRKGSCSARWTAVTQLRAYLDAAIDAFLEGRAP